MRRRNGGDVRAAAAAAALAVVVVMGVGELISRTGDARIRPAAECALPAPWPT